MKYQWNNMGCLLMLQCADALEYMHSKSVVHFDLKAANVLLRDSNHAKIAGGIPPSQCNVVIVLLSSWLP